MMNNAEFQSIKDYSYADYCRYLQNKNGLCPVCYMTEEGLKLPERSRTAEGLFLHHIREDCATMLCEREAASIYPYDWQRPENLVYCNYLEHLYLHVLICKYPNNEAKHPSAVGHGGVVNFLVPELNDLYSGFLPSETWKRRCFSVIRNNIREYYDILKSYITFKIGKVGKMYDIRELLKSYNTELWDSKNNLDIYGKILVIYEKCLLDFCNSSINVNCPNNNMQPCLAQDYTFIKDQILKKLFLYGTEYSILEYRFDNISSLSIEYILKLYIECFYLYKTKHSSRTKHQKRHIVITCGNNDKNSDEFNRKQHISETETQEKPVEYHEPVDYFCIIDTETNFNDQVMSIGAIVCNADDFTEVEKIYILIDPEYKLWGMYSSSLTHCKEFKIANRSTAIHKIKKLLEQYNVHHIFAYNAWFDCSHLPELKDDYRWYDIIRVAAYIQYNSKLAGYETFKTGKIKRGYSVESMFRLLSGDNSYSESHNALQDASDELTIMRNLELPIDLYLKNAEIRNSLNKIT